MNIVLASKSPRRKELLEKCCEDFICDPADIDESMNENNDLCLEIQNLSYRKANEVLQRHQEALVIGSDTIVVCNGKVLGKPKDRDDAFGMLKELQNQTHEVITGLCLLTKDKKVTDASVSKVTFAAMSDEEIWEYINTSECDDKAGAYAIQGFGARYIKHIEGDYYAIMGLPVQKVYQLLKEW